MQDTSTFEIATATAEEQAAASDLTVAAYAEYAKEVSDQGWWVLYRQNIIETVMSSNVAAESANGSVDSDRASESGPVDDKFDVIVAKQGGALVGSVLYAPRFTRAPNSAHFRLLAVAPEARRQGIGKALTQECLRRARANGASFMLLHTTDMMKVAQSMYVRMGFVRAPEFDWEVPPDPAPERGSILIKCYRLDLA